MKNPILFGFAFLALATTGAPTPSNFATPARTYAPHVWWHWMDGNVTREGITADLEAMAAAGIAGAQAFDCKSSTPLARGPVDFASPTWFEMIRHAHLEAQRLGLELVLANCSGYSSSGGPWVRPEDSMKVVTTCEKIVHAGETVTLPEPTATNCFYRDIAVIAFPVPAALSFAGEGAPGDEVDFGEPKLISEMRYSFAARETIWDREDGLVELALEASDDGKTWREVLKFTDELTPNFHVMKFPRYRALPESITVRYVRTRVNYRANYARKTAPAGPIAFGCFGRIADYHGRILAMPSETYAAGRAPKLAAPVNEGGVAVRKESVIDLTARVKKDGTLDWTAPEGRWTIMRVGYKSTGAVCSPATAAGRGLEVDKLDRQAVGRFFNGYIAKLVDCCGIDPKSDTHGRAGFNSVLIDSWEVGAQNWTHGFERTFEKCRGYDLLPFLPVFAGYYVESAAATDRFTRDFATLVAEEFGANYADELSRLCHAHGLLLQVEPYSGMPCTSERYARSVDRPQCEFWWKRPGEVEMDKSCVTVPRLAHEANREIISAESFTSFPEDDDWLHSPRDYKAIGDYAYCHGVNRIVYHRFAHQPKVNERPGMTMGYWGTHFDRTQTWWPLVGDWVRYQTRCQYLLQTGDFVDDVVETGAVRSVTFDSDERLGWIHRSYGDGIEAWFIASTNECGGRYRLALADTGRFAPEIWDPETGEIRGVAYERDSAGRTVLELPLGYCGSAFIVFRPDGNPPPPARTLSMRLPIDTAWTVEFPEHLGAPASIQLAALTNLSAVADLGVKFFSGIARYRTKVTLEPSLRQGGRYELELGEVGVVSRVTVNGKAAPLIAWHPPYCVEVTEGVKAATNGALELEIEVANTWVNRLIGDEVMFPKDDPRRIAKTAYRPWRKKDVRRLPASGLQGPVTLKIYQ